MYVSANQIYVFLACVAFGGSVGILFSVSCGIKALTKWEILRILSDVLAFIVSLVFYVIYANVLKFPTFRMYMPLGVFVGILAYFKSFHIILAKYVKLIYNILVKKYLKVKNGRIKSKKNNRRDHRRRSTLSGYSSIGNDLSVNIHVGKK